jgi:undecaprenyl-diphosphatase
VPDLLKAVILGVIQGLTEFLPVSSTGHLVIAEEALGISHGEFGLRFDAAIHLGTLTAVLVYYRTLLVSLAGDWLLSLRTRDWAITPSSRLAWLLLLGTIPAGLAGLALESTAEDAFRSPALVAVMLIVFSGPLLLAEWVAGRHSAVETSAAGTSGAAGGSGAFALHRPGRELSQASALDALIYGFAQSIALIPGVSRSGITISAGMLRGFRREEAASFTFLLSAPIIAAAGGKQLFDVARGEASGGNDIGIYVVGLITAAIVGYAAIAFLLRYLRTNTLYVFVAYRILLGVLVLGLVAADVL